MFRVGILTVSDKGHAGEVDAFRSACTQGGAWPIPWDQLEAVSLATLLAVQSLREGVPLDLEATE